VLPSAPSALPGSPIRPSRNSRRRAAVLIAVHVVFIAHLVHWSLAGQTLSPVEPSEAMETIRAGRVNAGALFFAAALAATLVLGRFFCGWGCHLVALQDLCGWFLKRIGLRPRPFRSRLLVFVPLLAALYMFVWPAVHRWWVGAARPPWTNHVTKAEFWETFPGPVIAVLTLAVCGFAIVYFLGNKGFCTYACPYGGFFGVLDRLAVGRIRVTDACNQCGHCSAVCTSNVRVAEEVKLYRMVVDPGCMKCMDCVSVCPNDALYFGFGRPELLAPKPPAARKAVRFDGSWTEEAGMAVVFAASVLVWRGLYGQVPFLFSLGLAAITTFIALKAWHLLRRRDLSMHHLQLKRGGTIRPAGRAFLFGAAALGLFFVHSAFIQAAQWRGTQFFERTAPAVGDWPLATSLRPLPTQSERSAAAAAGRWLARAERFGLFRSPAVDEMQTWLDLLHDGGAAAADRLARLTTGYPKNSGWRESYAACLLFLGRDREAEQAARAALDRAPHSAAARGTLGMIRFRRGEFAAAADAFAAALERAHHRDEHGEIVPLSPVFVSYRAEACRRAGRFDDAFAAESQAPVRPDAMMAEWDRSLRLDPKSAWKRRARAAARVRSAALVHPAQAARLLQIAAEELLAVTEADADDFLAWMHLALARAGLGDLDGALAALVRAQTIAPDSWTVPDQRAVTLTMARRYDAALAEARLAAERNPRSADVRARLGAVILARGDVAGAVETYREAVRLAPDNEEYRLRLAYLLHETGRSAEAAALLAELSRSPDLRVRQSAAEMAGR